MKIRYQELAALTFFCALLVYILACVLSPISWSPDGRWIGVTRFLDKEKEDGEKEVVGTELWVVSPPPIVRHRLYATSGTFLSGPAWSRDGKHLYALEVERSNDGSTPSVTLWKIGLDGKRTKLARLAPKSDVGGTFLNAPAPAPDERRIAIARDDSTVVIVRADGKVEREIEADEPGSLWWSPDGRWLGVQSKSDQADVPVRFFDMNSNRSVALDKNYRMIAWLPSGDRLVAWKVIEREGAATTHQIVLVDVKAGMREVASYALDFEPGVALVPSRRGDAVFTATADDNKMSTIHRIDLRSGKQTVLYDSTGWVVPWAVSPDGKYLAFRESPPVEKDQLAFVSIVGVMNLDAPEKIAYLAVDDRQWNAVIATALDTLAAVSPEEIEPSMLEQVHLTLKWVERFLSEFQRDFPDSPLLKECSSRYSKLKSAFQSAGIGLAPGEGGPNW